MRKLIIILTIFISTNSFGQSISKATQGIVNKLGKLNQIECKRVGFGGSLSKQYETYLKLCKKATTKELIKLTNYPNGVVRCYAFKCLSNRLNVDLFPIILNHLTDTTVVQYLCYDIATSFSVGDYFIQVVTSYGVGRGNGQHILTEEQRSILDSILIFQKGIRLGAKYSLLQVIKPKPKYHDRLRQIAIKEKNGEAIIALARYKNPNDIALIKDFFNNEKNEYWAIYAAKVFPDSSFYKYLVKIFKRDWKEKYYDYSKWKILFQALSKYPCQKTFELFKKTTETKDKFKYQTLCTYLKVAITKYPNALFDPLKSKIKLDNFQQNQAKRLLENEN